MLITYIPCSWSTVYQVYMPLSVMVSHMSRLSSVLYDFAQFLIILFYCVLFKSQHSLAISVSLVSARVKLDSAWSSSRFSCVLGNRQAKQLPLFLVFEINLRYGSVEPLYFSPEVQSWNLAPTVVILSRCSWVSSDLYADSGTVPQIRQPPLLLHSFPILYTLITFPFDHVDLQPEPVISREINHK